ncbi:MAG: DUF1192 domain-containing protein [Pseudomonadota bacterium]
MFDEELPIKKKETIERNLEPLSLDELSSYISELKAEITRTEAEIEKKKAHMNDAASVFK